MTDLLPASTRLRRGTFVAALAAATVLAGCSSGSHSSADSTFSSAASAPSPASGGDQALSAAEGSAKGAAGTTVSTEVDDQKLARTGTLSLQVKNIAEATAKVRAINLAAGGVILSENIGSYQGAPSNTDEPAVNPNTYAVLVISVPVAKLDATLDELQTVGTVLDRRSDTQNRTAEYVDVQARITSMKKSVERVQALIDKTNDIDQLVRLERELSSRQADLESIEAQLKALQREVDRSPITVNLATKSDLIPQTTTPATGFLGGLKSGWNAFVGSLVALLTVLGAVLPFAIFVALIGIPALWLWRKWRARNPGKLTPRFGPTPALAGAPAATPPISEQTPRAPEPPTE